MGMVQTHDINAHEGLGSADSAPVSGISYCVLFCYFILIRAFSVFHSCIARIFRPPYHESIAHKSYASTLITPQHD
jgi:hypothetical protein